MKQWKYIKGSEKDFEGAPEWATLRTFTGGCAFFAEGHMPGSRVYDIARKGDYFIIKDAIDIGFITTIAQRELIEVWKGEGLPPVGTVCQWDNGENDWCNVKVMGISDGELWVKPLDGSQSFVVCDGDFRPVQNEREKAIKEIIGVISPTEEDPCNLAGKLYDAGYRNKPELVDGYDVHHWSSLAKERFHQFNALETEIIGVRKMVTDTFKYLESGMKYYKIAGTKHDDI